MLFSPWVSNPPRNAGRAPADEQLLWAALKFIFSSLTLEKKVEYDERHPELKGPRNLLIANPGVPLFVGPIGLLDRPELPVGSVNAPRCFDVPCSLMQHFQSVSCPK
jgi:hypothetical protein